MASRTLFLDLSNDIILMILDILAFSPPRLDLPIEMPTPLKHLSATNRRLRQLVRPYLLERITLDNRLAQPNYKTAGYHLSSATQAIAALSENRSVCDNIRRFSFNTTHTWRDTLSYTTVSPRYDILVEFISRLNKLQHLTVRSEYASSLFEGAIKASSALIFLRLESIKTLHIGERYLNLLTYCPNVQHFVISQIGEPLPSNPFDINRPYVAAPSITQLEVEGDVKLCRMDRMPSLGLEFPNVECLRFTETAGLYEAIFERWVHRLGDTFSHLKVLAVSRQVFEQFIVGEPSDDSANVAPFAGADDFARMVFDTLDSLEELWLEPDHIAIWTRSSDPDFGDSGYRVGREDQAGLDSRTGPSVQWVWTRPSDPLVRPVEWIV
ncbi:hypothetical protein P171DRAFT_428885 [Karstenula rhodostoma CBS 690.94]|uniref:Uncharacterized protein n=1 Tax=Karstenula rhodostoma CBS 690.94 TaxID=1392251 RepID=A0A9P4UEG6_9PLEO|nr:hypothetical protein P171DRAFT_428885 [Karstenula rhodostoma CBS 690.94]